MQFFPEAVSGNVGHFEEYAATFEKTVELYFNRSAASTAIFAMPHQSSLPVADASQI